MRRIGGAPVVIVERVVRVELNSRAEILDRQRVKVWLRKVYSELDSLGLSRPSRV